MTKPAHNPHTTQGLAEGDRVVLEGKNGDKAEFKIESVLGLTQLSNTTGTNFDLETWTVVDVEYTMPTSLGIYISYVNDRDFPDVVQMTSEGWFELNTKVKLAVPDVLALMPLTPILTMGRAVNIVQFWIEKEQHPDWSGPLRDGKEILSKSLGDRYRGRR